jgi:pSer/pThr/pTyr-binding forkhead associated (FHA) protein
VNNQLARFERLLERLVEDPLIRLFSGELHPQELVARLGRAMEDRAEGKRAPDHYQVLLNPNDRDALLEAEPDLPQLLADEVCALAEQAALTLPSEPVVELTARPEMPRQTVRVTARVTGQQAQQTQSLDREKLRRQAGLGPDGSTYLIVGGQQHVSLTRTIYTLGRRLDCDVVLCDPTVSRRHAQLRWRFGRYVLYDLGSRAGTRVNGHLVAEAVLEPGDVVTLGVVDIIYGQDAGDGASRSDDSSSRTWTRPKVLL